MRALKRQRLRWFLYDLRHPFYVGDGQYGFRRWLWANWLWRVLPWRFAPALPDGWQWNVRKYWDKPTKLYARHDS